VPQSFHALGLPEARETLLGERNEVRETPAAELVRETPVAAQVVIAPNLSSSREALSAVGEGSRSLFEVLLRYQRKGSRGLLGSTHHCQLPLQMPPQLARWQKRVVG